MRHRRHSLRKLVKYIAISFVFTLLSALALPFLPSPIQPGQERFDEANRHQLANTWKGNLVSEAYGMTMWRNGPESVEYSILDHSQFGYRNILIGQWKASNGKGKLSRADLIDQTRMSFSGWPLRCLRGTVYSHYQTTEYNWAFDPSLFSNISAVYFSEWRLVPLKIILVPFLLNMMLYCAVVYATAIVFSERRRWHDNRELKRGRCPRCSYDISGMMHERCPECAFEISEYCNIRKPPTAANTP